MVRLNGRRGVTVILPNPNDERLATRCCDIATTGKIKSVKGHFTNFGLVIDQFAAALPSSRSVIKFENRANGVETSCDILIDLTGDTPLFTGCEKRDGYFRAAGDYVPALAAVEREDSQMIGDLAKPKPYKY